MKIEKIYFCLRLVSSACGRWAAGGAAGPASQERMLTTGGRRQTDRKTWAVELSALQVGRNKSMHSFCQRTCRTEDTFLNDASVAVASYCYPYLSKCMEAHCHFMTVALRRSDAQREYWECLWFSLKLRVDSTSPNSVIWILAHSLIAQVIVTATSDCANCSGVALEQLLSYESVNYQPVTVAKKAFYSTLCSISVETSFHCLTFLVFSLFLC